MPALHLDQLEFDFDEAASNVADSETLAYLAGLFDGEGCVSFTTSGQQRSWVIRAYIRNSDRAVIDFVQSIFDGRIEITTNWQKPKWKPSYCWRADRGDAIKFLVAIEPWVRIKGEQILVAKFWDAIRLRPGRHPDNAYKEMVGLLVKQLRWLNKKGPRAIDDVEPIQECLDTLPCSWTEIATGVGSDAIN